MNVSANTGGIDKINNAHAREDFRKGKNPGSANRRKQVGTEDKMDISLKTFDLNTLQATIMQIPDIRGQKVTEFKTRIANGGYRVSNEDIAERLIEDALIA